MPRYFGQTKYRSFQRQLAIYGFVRIKDKNCADDGAYYHELFLKGKHSLCLNMTRQKIKGTKDHAIQSGGAHLNFSPDGKSASPTPEPISLLQHPSEGPSFGHVLENVTSCLEPILWNDDPVGAFDITAQRASEELADANRVDSSKHPSFLHSSGQKPTRNSERMFFSSSTVNQREFAKAGFYRR
jgi:hypothetical protein